MKRLRQLVRNYFGFSKTETNGFLVLVPLMVFLLFVPTLYVKVFSQSYDGYEKDQQILDSLLASWNEALVIPEKVESMPMRKYELHAFDPNHAKENDLKNLGVPAFLAKRIVNYRNKGGSFRVKSDLSRIYDFPDTLYRLLEPHIELPDVLEKRKPTYSTVKTSGASMRVASFSKPTEEKPRLWLDLNTSDTTDLKQLRGIGPSYSRRIIKYRELLGGFSGQAQLAEVYGLSDSLYNTLADQVFVQEEYVTKKINVNIAGFKVLNRHPYISYKQAGAILNRRSKKGKFRSPSDLLVVEGIDSASVSKLTPYITF